MVIYAIICTKVDPVELHSQQGEREYEYMTSQYRLTYTAGISGYFSGALRVES